MGEGGGTEGQSECQVPLGIASRGAALCARFEFRTNDFGRCKII